MDMERTIILGSQDAWTGRVHLRVNMSATKLFEFYKLEMPGFGWQEVTSVRAIISVLTYERGSRVATIQILYNKIKGTVVCGAIFAGNAGTIHTKDDRKMLDSTIVYDMIICSL